MNAVAFDTLKLARRLEQAGFSREQAGGAAEALAETFSGELATKTDLVGVRAEIGEFRADMRTEMAELRADIAKLGGDLRGEIASVRWNTAQWVVGALFLNAVTVVGGFAAVWQLAHR